MSEAKQVEENKEGSRVHRLFDCAQPSLWWHPQLALAGLDSEGWDDRQCPKLMGKILPVRFGPEIGSADSFAYLFMSQTRTGCSFRIPALSASPGYLMVDGLKEISSPRLLCILNQKTVGFLTKIHASVETLHTQNHLIGVFKAMFQRKTWQ